MGAKQQCRSTRCGCYEEQHSCWPFTKEAVTYLLTVYFGAVLITELEVGHSDFELSSSCREMLAMATFASLIADEGSNNDSSPAGSGRSPLGPQCGVIWK